MRDVLCGRLYAAHPDLYAMRHGAPNTNAIRDWGIEHGDGWFAITAALSEVVAARVPAARVLQCKAEFTAYSFYLAGADEFCQGAIGAAMHVALRFSEVSGLPGRPMVKRLPLARVLAGPEAQAGWWDCSGLDGLPASARLVRLDLDGDAAAENAATDEVGGALAFLNRLVRRVDRVTGAIGPVDDRGMLYVIKRRRA